MNIQDRRALKQEAASRLSASSAPKKIVFIYLAVSMALSVLLSICDLLLSRAMQDTSGLGDFGTRSILQTAQTILPYLNLLFLMCWELGYTNAILRISRKVPADEKSLTRGFSLFGVALRSSMLQGLIYLGLILVCSYGGAMIYMMSPFASPLIELLEPYVNDASLLSGATLALDDATLAAMENAMLPAVGIILIVFAAIAIPISYRLRMVNYVVLDNPHAGALNAIRESRKMMRGNCKALLRIDLSYWWYYALCLLAALVCYGDVILSYFDVALPMSDTLAAILFYGLYFAITFAINIPLKNKISQTYALVYDAIRPKPQPTEGVVLGNIFQM